MLLQFFNLDLVLKNATFYTIDTCRKSIFVLKKRILKVFIAKSLNNFFLILYETD